MVRDIKYSFILFSATILLSLVVWSASAQNIDAFARVSVSPREGVVRQPYKVTISVYSSTWFAKPLQFTNFRIDDAFIIPFTRTVSGINYLNNKKYATLTFYYLVFPYNTGLMQIPELVIHANIPPEGDYRGQDYTIRTKAQSIKVSELPSSKEEPVWMVANSISIKESWSRSLNNLKVGDVLEREIQITAEGTLPSLIQPLEIEKPELTSIYPKQADLQDTRNNQNANGKRIEYYSYLFEEEGEVIIPPEEVLWWNPLTKRVYKRTIAENKISIAANPDLELMESLKDSLMAMSAPEITDVEEKSVPWVNIVFFLFLLIITLYFSIKTIKLLLQHRKANHKAYLQSEEWYFKQVEKALQKGDKKQFLNSLYRWFDEARNAGMPASIRVYLNENNRNLLEELTTSPGNGLEQKGKLVKLLKNLRKEILYSESESGSKSGLNPIH